jgi:fermentation-respiration switch protein FrsA (DUF1100 family)
MSLKKEILWALSPLPVAASPFWKRTWKHRVARLLLGVVYCYIGVVLLLLWFENRMLYVGAAPGQGWADTPPGVKVEEVTLTSADGTSLHAWWSQPPGWTPYDGALLFAHGNGANLSHRGGCIQPLQHYLRTGVLLFDYPGYGRSGGSPTEAGCYAAGDAAYDWLTKNRQVPVEQIILYGGSLGGGIATDLAVRKPHRALVLVSTFTSFPEQAQKVMPWFPARWLARNKYDNVAKLAKVTGPVFIVHGKLDNLIPFAMGERLYAAAKEPKKFFAEEYGGHGDFPGLEAIAELRKFLAIPAPGAAR